MKKLLALLMALIMIFSVVGAHTAAYAEEPVTLKIWFHGSNVAPDSSKKVLDELNVYLQDKIGAKLEVIWGTWGDFDQSVVTALAGGDDVDMVFTCNWSGDEYNRYARDGYWVKLDDMLPEYAPDLLSLIPEGIWECAKTNGYDGIGIYAVPALKDTATQNCWDVNGTLLAELGYDVDAVCAAGLDYYSDEFEEMLQKAKDLKASEGENDFYPLCVEPMVLERLVDVSSIVTGDLGGGNVLSYYYDKDHPSKDIGSQIVNKFATPEFEKYAKRTYELAQKGFISLPLNVLYALVLIFWVYQSYRAVNLLFGSAERTVGVEPLLFGVLAAVWDLVFLWMKRTAKAVLRDAKRKAMGDKQP